MQWLLRAKGGAKVVRDGRFMSDPVKRVGPDKFVPFEHLPLGMPEHGDGDFEVVKVVSPDLIELLDMPVELEPVVLEKPPKPEPKAEEPKPAKPKKNRPRK